MHRTVSRVLACAVLVLLVAGCSPRINILGGSSREPLEEQTIEGRGTDKILLVRLQGTLKMSPSSGLLHEKPSPVQRLDEQLAKAKDDSRIKAVVVSINSPGGTVGASDVCYDLIRRYKQETGNPVVAVLMEVAASGGYYTAAAADRIIAHPATITGSIGTIFLRPDLSGLLDWVRVGVEVTKSGNLKDMGSPFRASTEQERALFQQMILDENARFLDIVRTSRNLDENAMHAFDDGRVLTAQQAMDAGLVDSLGYLHDGYDAARQLSGAEEDARVVVYQRREYPDDTGYNTMARSPIPGGAAAAFDVESALGVPQAGLYHLWPGAFGNWE